MAIFGYEEQGKNYDILDDSDYFRGYRFTTPSNIGPVSKLTFFGSFGPYRAKGIIVLQSNLNIVANGIGNPSDDGYGWHNSIFAIAPILEPSTDYILGIVSEDAIFFYYDDGVANYSYQDDNNNYANPINPVGAITKDYKYSIYATYTPTAPPSPNLTDRNNYNGYLAFIQQYIKHKINGTTPWKNPSGDLIE